MILTMVLFILLLVAWGLPVTTKSKQSVHMLQLNSYRNERYAKWMGSNRDKVFHLLEISYLLPVILAIISDSINITFISATVVFVLTFVVFWKTKPTQKKKLVITPRVQRLFSTTYIIYGLMAAAAIILSTMASLAVTIIFLSLVAVLPFYVVRLANTINGPIEAKISEGFVKDAKRLLDTSPDLKVIGITGSYGKTSVKHFVHAVLSDKFNVLMTPESYNTKLGVTRTINEQLKPYHDILIAEMGAKQEGDIQEICELVNQKYGILTAIGEQHLETFKTLDTIKKTKHEIVETLPEKDGVAILNKDDENIMSHQAKNPCRRVYYGVNEEDVDLRATNIAFSPKGTSFTVRLVNGEEEQFRTRLLGKHNVYNILAALAIGLEMGMSLKQMIQPVKKIEPVKHRLEYDHR